MRKFLSLALLVFCSWGLSCKETSKPTRIPIIEPRPVPITIDEYPCWSPDGKTIAYVHKARNSEESRRGLFQIWFVEIETGERRYLTEGDLPDFPPDGNWLAFVRDRDIYIMKLNGDSMRQLTFGYEKGDFFPDWSPDGKLLIYDFAEGSAGLGYSIWVMNPWTGEKRDLDISGRDPCWSPDGEWFAYKGHSDSCEVEDIFIARKDATEVKQLTCSPFDGVSGHNTASRNAAWSPDGSTIAFSSFIYPKYDIWIPKILERG